MLLLLPRALLIQNGIALLLLRDRRHMKVALAGTTAGHAYHLPPDPLAHESGCTRDLRLHSSTGTRAQFEGRRHIDSFQLTLRHPTCSFQPHEDVPHGYTAFFGLKPVLPGAGFKTGCWPCRASLYPHTCSLTAAAAAVFREPDLEHARACKHEQMCQRVSVSVCVSVCACTRVYIAVCM